jgi:NAD(P)-dependent dehydrogenase (short-subunit alcohol dehydrogenase family)
MTGRNDAMGFTDKTALVTGSGRGIGEAIVRMLAHGGARVAVCDIDVDAASAVARSIEAGSGRALALKADVSDEASVASAFEETARKLGPVDILVNNAGVLNTGSTGAMDVRTWDRTMAINLRGPFLCCRAALDGMQRRGWGRIVNIASLAGQSGGIKTGADYSASKAGVIAFTKKLALEVAAYGITVNAVAPGTTETEMVQKMSEDQRADLRKAIPLGRFGRPDDIAYAVCFLAGEEAGFITGATLDVNGGLLMR